MGIRVHGTKRAMSTENDRHERMHGSLNRVIGRRMRGGSLVQQQLGLQAFREENNAQRSQEAQRRRTKASVYQPSQRANSPVLRPIEYQVDQSVRNVRDNGEIKWRGQLIYLSELLEKHGVGLREVEHDRVESDTACIC